MYHMRLVLGSKISFIAFNFLADMCLLALQKALKKIYYTN